VVRLIFGQAVFRGEEEGVAGVQRDFSSHDIGKVDWEQLN